MSFQKIDLSKITPASPHTELYEAIREGDWAGVGDESIEYVIGITAGLLAAPAGAWAGPMGSMVASSIASNAATDYYNDNLSPIYKAELMRQII